MTHDTPTGNRKKAERAKPAKPGQRLMLGRHVEDEYGLPRRTTYDLYLRGKLAAIRLNKTLWFERAEIERLIQNSREVCT